MARKGERRGERATYAPTPPTPSLPVGVSVGIRDRTSMEGMADRAYSVLDGAQAAASAIGVDLKVVAAKGPGHKSHAGGTEWDVVGYHPDGTKWTNAERVAVAQGARQAGADRFGIYNMAHGLGQGTLHMGYSGDGRPAAIWGANGITSGPLSRMFIDPSERAFRNAYQSGATYPIPPDLLDAAREQRVQNAHRGLPAPPTIQGGDWMADLPSAPSLPGRMANMDAQREISTQRARGTMPGQSFDPDLDGMSEEALDRHIQDLKTKTLQSFINNPTSLLNPQIADQADRLGIVPKSAPNSSAPLNSKYHLGTYQTRQPPAGDIPYTHMPSRIDMAEYGNLMEPGREAARAKALGSFAPPIVSPPQPYTTSLTSSEEKQFKAWKQAYAPGDSGEDYDLRGAFKAGVTPDPETGHMPDTFKKPNHPTFSIESQYLRAAPLSAGRWTGPNHDIYAPPPSMVRPQGPPGALPPAPLTGTATATPDSPTTVLGPQNPLAMRPELPRGFSATVSPDAPVPDVMAGGPLPPPRIDPITGQAIASDPLSATADAGRLPPVPPSLGGTSATAPPPPSPAVSEADRAFQGQTAFRPEDLSATTTPDDRIAGAFGVVPPPSAPVSTSATGEVRQPLTASASADPFGSAFMPEDLNTASLDARIDPYITAEATAQLPPVPAVAGRPEGPPGSLPAAPLPSTVAGRPEFPGQLPAAPLPSQVATRPEFPGSLPAAPGPPSTFPGRPEMPGALPAAPPPPSTFASRPEMPGALPPAPPTPPLPQTSMVRPEVPGALPAGAAPKGDLGTPFPGYNVMPGTDLSQGPPITPKPVQVASIGTEMFGPPAPPVPAPPPIPAPPSAAPVPQQPPAPIPSILPPAPGTIPNPALGKPKQQPPTSPINPIAVAQEQARQEAERQAEQMRQEAARSDPSSYGGQGGYGGGYGGGGTPRGPGQRGFGGRNIDKGIGGGINPNKLILSPSVLAQLQMMGMYR